MERDRCDPAGPRRHRAHRRPDAGAAPGGTSLAGPEKKGQDEREGEAARVGRHETPPSLTLRLFVTRENARPGRISSHPMVRSPRLNAASVSRLARQVPAELGLEGPGLIEFREEPELLFGHRDAAAEDE